MTPPPMRNPLPPSRVLVPALVLLGLVVGVISSLGAPLIPSLAAEYAVSLSAAQWSLTVALLAGAVTAPVLGRLGDGPRQRVVVLAALGAVVVGCVLAALPLGFAALLAGRGLQGIGLGLVPLALTVVRGALGPEASRPAVALLSVTASAGVGLGYPVTGLLADLGGVRAPFWFGAAAATLTLGLVFPVLPSTAHRPARPLDWRGAVLLGAGLVALLLGLAEGREWGWTSPRLVAAAALGAAALAVFARRELRTPHPLVNLRLLRQPIVLAATSSALLVGVGIYLVLTMLTRFVQTPPEAGYGFGSSVLVAGLVLVPFSVASVAAARLLPGLARVVGRRAVLPTGALVLASSMVIFLVGRSQLWVAFVVMGLVGLGSGMVFAAVATLLTRASSTEDTGSSLGLNQVVRQVGFSMGSALGGAILAAQTPPGSALPSLRGYETVAVVGLGVCLVAAAVAHLLRRRAPEDPDEPAPAPIVGPLG